MKFFILAALVAFAAAQEAATFNIAVENDASVDAENAAAEAAVDAELSGNEKEAAHEFINGIKGGKSLTEIGDAISTKFNFSPEQSADLMTKLSEISEKASAAATEGGHHFHHQHHSRPYPVNFN